MVTYTAKKKRDLIIAGSVLTGAGVAYVAGWSILASNIFIGTSNIFIGTGDNNTIPLPILGLLAGTVYGGELLLIPGIVTLSLGLAAKTK